MANSTEVPHLEDGPPQTNAPDESQKERLTDLTARAMALYAVKKYEEAAELYSEATEIQAEVNGEMAEENADLLFAYGRCLFHVAQKTSTVLGGTAASAQLKGSDKKPSKKRKANGTIKPESSTTAQEAVTATSQPADVVPAADVDPEEAKPATSDKPFFHIEGDAPDWGDTDDEEDDVDDAQEEDEEEEDDFNTAFEVLDMSRILYLRTLDGKDKSSSRDLRVRISDVYDLQAEISLEGERFDAAVTDLRSCLDLKEGLYEPDSSLLAECHYKLSLALEAASQVQQRDDDGNPVGDITIDWDLRNEAVAQQDKAIQSCKLRVTKETTELDGVPPEKKQRAREQIEDVQDMINAMAQRLEELKKPPVSVKAEAEKSAQQELMGSVLGQVLGAAGEQKGKLAEIMAGANDLSGMVKRKKPKPAPANGNAEPAAKPVQPPQEAPSTDSEVSKGKGKRKLEDVEAETQNDTVEPVKKVRIEDVID